MNYNFHHVHIVCKDLDRMISFFTNTLKARLLAIKEFDGAKGAKIDSNGTHINLRVPLENEQINNHQQDVLGIHHLAFQVDNCDSAYNEIKTEGYRFINAPKTSGNIRTAFFNGPENIVIELIQFFNTR
jgi:catechol 2,3-dioxygenase-like lactoylglutathione lyase family enzyme